MCLHYLGKFEVSDWAVNAVIKCAFVTFEWLTELHQTWLTVIVSQNSHCRTCHATQSLFQRVLEMSASSMNASSLDADVTLSSSTVNSRATQSGPLADASFQFVDVRYLGTIDLPLKHTPHGVVNCIEVRWVSRSESGWDKIIQMHI